MHPVSIDLRNRTAIVTGAAGGIGVAIAAELLRSGARVAALDHDMGALLDATAHLAPAQTGQLRTWECNVADEDAVSASMARIASEMDAPAILINNAARVTPGNAIGALPANEWRATLDVNLTGAWLMTVAALPHMRARKHGVIVNMASQLGVVAAPGRGAYGVSKAGLIALARAIAVDHAHEGIRALSLSPGAVLTDRVKTRYGGQAGAQRALAHKYPLGRLGTVEEVAYATCFLVSDAAAFISGVNICADGGYTAW